MARETGIRKRFEDTLLLTLKVEEGALELKNAGDR